MKLLTLLISLASMMPHIAEGAQPRQDSELYPNLAYNFQGTDSHTGRGGWGATHQCGAVGQGHTPLMHWTPVFLFDTDTDWGGCMLSLGIQDPREHFGHTGSPTASYKISMADQGGRGRCRPPGTNIPLAISSSTDPLYFGGNVIIVDTDKTAHGPCVITFSADGATRSGVTPSWKVRFSPNIGNGAGQCSKSWKKGNIGQTRPGHPISITIDTVGNSHGKRPGGCRLELMIVG
jgi:hypothetical protein